MTPLSLVVLSGGKCARNRFKCEGKCQKKTKICNGECFDGYEKCADECIPKRRRTYNKAMLQNAFLTNIPVEKNVMMECSSVGTNATLTIIKPGMGIENAMESAFQNRSNAMELVPMVTSRVENTAAGK